MQLTDMHPEMTSYIHHPVLGDLRVESSESGELEEVFFPNGSPLCAVIVEEYGDEIEQLVFEDEPIDPDLELDEERHLVILSPRTNHLC